SQKRVLAIFTVRRGTLTPRLELIDTEKPYTDALVLTSILAVTEKDEYEWHNRIQARRDAVAALCGGPAEEAGMASALLDEGLPTYWEVPFTRSVDPLLDPPSLSLPRGRIEFTDGSYWTTTPNVSSASVSLDQSANIRYECCVEPLHNPLATFDHYLNREGTVVELTLEGHGVLVDRAL
ncbi:hypothetical protein FRC11_007446, partial [Ceratobasidium sp. 423]